MRSVKTLLIAGGLAALIAPACERNEGSMDRMSPKGVDERAPKSMGDNEVEEREKAAARAREEMNQQREDVAEERRELSEQKGELGQATAEFTKRRDEFAAKARAKLDALEGRIAAIRADVQAHGAELKKDAKQEMDELVMKLEEQRGRARSAFDAAASGTEERWNELEQNTGEALDDLEETASSAVGKLKDAGVKVRAELDARID